MTMEDERNLDLLVAELEHENKLMRARNERLEREINAIAAERDGFKEALERILAVSKLALWDSRPKGIGEVGPSKQDRRHIED
jgi:hypothetical protein